MSGSQNEFILELLEFALQNNFFQFLSTFYHQIRGTSMGAAWAPAYACLHLGIWEEEDVYTSLMYRRHVLTRHIDDVLMLWWGTNDALHQFMLELNQNQRNIWLTYTFDFQKLSFLDLQIIMNQGQQRYSGEHTTTRNQPSSSMAKKLNPCMTVPTYQKELFKCTRL